MRSRIARFVRARWWLVCILAGVTACATAPPRRTETTAIRQIREEYLRTYPEGPHNAEINRGEIVKGMSLYEVLASWGIPDLRRVSSERDREEWTYVLLDDNAVDWVSYDCVFHGNQLVEWFMNRNAGGTGAPVVSKPTDNLAQPLPPPSWATRPPESHERPRCASRPNR